MKPAFHILLFIFAVLPLLHSQPALQLDTVSERKGHPVIEVTMGDGVYEKISDIRGSKLIVKEVPLIIDGKRTVAKDMKLRGNSSLEYRRKSFTVDLEKEALLPFDGGEVSLRKFYLVSMNMDQHYFHNKLAFACLERLGLFGLREGYVELRINAQTKGVYMVMERPQDHIMDDLGSPFYLRRGYANSIEEDKAKKGFDKKMVETARQRYHSIYPEKDSLQGEALYYFLDQRLNLPAYMQWMAFNYLVGNGDYSDELFFFLPENPDSLRFEVMAWDYDDIFAAAPHEGKQARSEWLGDQLIFSAESSLDRLIGKDEYMYHRYLEEMRKVLETLSPEWVAAQCTEIYGQLTSYYRRKAIVQMAAYDRGGSTGEEDLKTALSQSFEYYFVKRRAEILKALDEQGI